MEQQNKEKNESYATVFLKKIAQPVGSATLQQSLPASLGPENAPDIQKNIALLMIRKWHTEKLIHKMMKWCAQGQNLKHVENQIQRVISYYICM